MKLERALNGDICKTHNISKTHFQYHYPVEDSAAFKTKLTGKSDVGFFYKYSRFTETIRSDFSLIIAIKNVSMSG